VREALLLLFPRDAEQIEDPRLNVGTMDTDTARTRLLPVADQIVTLRPDLRGIGVEIGQMLGVGHGEGVMFRLPALLLFVPLHQRKVGDQRELQDVRIPKPLAPSDLQPEPAQDVGDDGRFGIRDDADQVARLRLDRCEDALQLFFCQELGNRRLHLHRTELRDGDRRQPLCSELFAEVPQIIDLFAGLRRAAGVADGFHLAAVREGRFEYGEAGGPNDLAEVGQFQAETHIGFVAAVAAERLIPGKTGERFRQLFVAQVLDHVDGHAFDELQDILLLHKRHFDIELSELRQTVGTLRLVPETAGDLEVALTACDHQELFVLLRRLRQRVEQAGFEAVGDQIVARAFRSALGEQRRFDLDERLTVHVVANAFDGPMPECEHRVHRRTAQVEIAVFDTQGLVHQAHLIFIGDLKRKAARGVENLQAGGRDFNLAGRQIRVFGAGTPRPYSAAHAHDELASEAVGGGDKFGGVLLIDDYLHDSGSVPQIDEDQISKIALAMRPPVQYHFSVDIGGPHRPAEFRSLPVVHPYLLRLVCIGSGARPCRPLAAQLCDRRLPPTHSAFSSKRNDTAICPPDGDEHAQGSADDSFAAAKVTSWFPFLLPSCSFFLAF